MTSTSPIALLVNTPPSAARSTPPGRDSDTSKHALATGIVSNADKKKLRRRTLVHAASDEPSEEKAGERREQVIPDRLLHSVQEAQVLLHCSHASVYRLLQRGALRSVKVGNSRRITREPIDDVSVHGA